MPPLEGEVPNEREAEGFVRKLSKKTPQSARSGCQLPFQGSQGGFAARVARLATPASLILLTMRSYIFNSCNRREKKSRPRKTGAWIQRKEKNEKKQNYFVPVRAVPFTYS